MPKMKVVLLAAAAAGSLTSVTVLACGTAHPEAPLVYLGGAAVGLAALGSAVMYRLLLFDR